MDHGTDSIFESSNLLVRIFIVVSSASVKAELGKKYWKSQYGIQTTIGHSFMHGAHQGRWHR